jgi:hypothetical protein
MLSAQRMRTRNNDRIHVFAEQRLPTLIHIDNHIIVVQRMNRRDARRRNRGRRSVLRKCAEWRMSSADHCHAASIIFGAVEPFAFGAPALSHRASRHAQDGSHHEPAFSSVAIKTRVRTARRSVY